MRSSLIENHQHELSVIAGAPRIELKQRHCRHHQDGRLAGLGRGESEGRGPVSVARAGVLNAAIQCDRALRSCGSHQAPNDVVCTPNAIRRFFDIDWSPGRTSTA